MLSKLSTGGTGNTELTKLFNSLISTKKAPIVISVLMPNKNQLKENFVKQNHATVPECTASSRCRQTGTALCLALLTPQLMPNQKITRKSTIKHSNRL